MLRRRTLLSGACGFRHRARRDRPRRRASARRARRPHAACDHRPAAERNRPPGRPGGPAEPVRGGAEAGRGSRPRRRPDRDPRRPLLASPVFHAADTAALAFGRQRVRIEPFLTADDCTWEAALLSASIARTRARLAQAPASGNDIRVGHIVPLGMVLGRPLALAGFPEGAPAMFRPGGGAAARLGIVTAEEIIAAAG